MDITCSLSLCLLGFVFEWRGRRGVNVASINKIVIIRVRMKDCEMVRVEGRWKKKMMWKMIEARSVALVKSTSSQTTSPPQKSITNIDNHSFHPNAYSHQSSPEFFVLSPWYEPLSYGYQDAKVRPRIYVLPQVLGRHVSIVPCNNCPNLSPLWGPKVIILKFFIWRR